MNKKCIAHIATIRIHTNTLTFYEPCEEAKYLQNYQLPTQNKMTIFILLRRKLLDVKFQPSSPRG